MEQIMRYSIFLIAGGMCIIQRYLRKQIKDFPKAESKCEEKYLIFQPVILLICSIYLIFCCDTVEYLYGWKLMSLVAILAEVAYVDYKLQIIPNEYLKIGILLRGIILVIELLQNPSAGISNLINELLGCVTLFVFCVLLRIISRQGLGMGDLKLLAMMPLFLGIVGCLETTFYAIIIIFVQACVCLITRKKGKKDTLPFAPAICGGTLVWILCLGM